MIHSLPPSPLVKVYSALGREITNTCYSGTDKVQVEKKHSKRRPERGGWNLNKKCSHVPSSRAVNGDTIENKSWYRSAGKGTAPGSTSRGLRSASGNCITDNDGYHKIHVNLGARSLSLLPSFPLSLLPPWPSLSFLCLLSHSFLFTIHNYNHASPAKLKKF